MNKKQKISMILNCLIVLLTIFATVSMIIGFQFMGEIKVLSSASFKAFKYFTVDSNVFAGLVSLVYLIFLCLLAKGKIKALPKWLNYLKLAATTGVTLTMMVTVFFLAPRTTTTYFAYFMNSNLFMHLLTPLLCIITFAFFEPAKLSFAESLIGTCPMILYSIYYIPNILIHLENGKVLPEYDWYGFLFAGLNTIWFVIPLILLITWIFSICLWFVNKKCSDK
ncbi:MAG: hypothetical protein K5786_08160 [Treponema sp.]|nr:hypothetical protein [Treponema sp.]